MTGRFQFADLTLEYEDNFKNLIRVQKVEREVDRACEDLAAEAGCSPDDVTLILDEIDPPDGNSFDLPRLQVIDPPLIYTIDVSQSDQPNNPLGYYVAYDKPIDVYDWDTERSKQIPRGDDRSIDDEVDDAVGQSSSQSSNPPADTGGGGIEEGQENAIEKLARGHSVSIEDVLEHAQARGYVEEGKSNLDALSFDEAAQVIKMLQADDS